MPRRLNAEHVRDEVASCREVVQDELRRQPQDGEPCNRKRAVPALVSTAPARVMRAVHLHDQPRRRSEEVSVRALAKPGPTPDARSIADAPSTAAEQSSAGPSRPGEARRVRAPARAQRSEHGRTLRRATATGEQAARTGLTTTQIDGEQGCYAATRADPARARADRAGRARLAAETCRQPALSNSYR